MKIKQLLQRIDAEDGSQALDIEVLRVLHGPEWDPATAQPVTTSLDAAFQLIRTLFLDRPIGFLEGYFSQTGLSAGLIGDIKGAIDLKYCVVGSGKTPALALCSAALIAKGDLEDPEP